jgi:hypothetical protein
LGVCSAVKSSGERCKARATEGSEWCWNHNPAHAAERKHHAAKGGKRGGRGRPVAELGDLRAENAEIRERLLEGELLPGVAAVAIQSLNCDIRAVSAALKAREQLELTERLEALEEALERKGDRRWGA